MAAKEEIKNKVDEDNLIPRPGETVTLCFELGRNAPKEVRQRWRKLWIDLTSGTRHNVFVVRWRSRCTIESNRGLPTHQDVGGLLGSNGGKQIRFNSYFELSVLGDGTSRWTIAELRDLRAAFCAAAAAYVEQEDIVHGWITFT
jgi:hypothetical protein